VGLRQGNNVIAFLSVATAVVLVIFYAKIFYGLRKKKS
jgi:hypothetical protein